MQELFIERAGHGITLDDDGSVPGVSKKVRHRGIKFLSSWPGEFLKSVSLDDEQFVLMNPGAFLSHTLLEFLRLVLFRRKAAEIVESAILEESAEEKAVLQRLEVF